MSRKLLAPLAVVLAFALAACGGDAPAPDNSTAPPADAAPADPAAPPAT